MRWSVLRPNLHPVLAFCTHGILTRQLVSFRDASQLMLKATARLWQAAALTADLLKADLPQQWFGKLARPHIGTI